MDIKNKNIRNKIIAAVAVLFAPLFIIQLIILILLSKNIISVLTAAILSAIIVVVMMSAAVTTLLSFFNPLVSVFTGNTAQNTTNNKMLEKIQKIAERNDGMG